MECYTHSSHTNNWVCRKEVNVEQMKIVELCNCWLGRMTKWKFFCYNFSNGCHSFNNNFLLSFFRQSVRKKSFLYIWNMKTFLEYPKTKDVTWVIFELFCMSLSVRLQSKCNRYRYGNNQREWHLFIEIWVSLERCNTTEKQLFLIKSFQNFLNISKLW